MKNKIDIYKTRLTEKVEDSYIAHQERISGKIIGNQMCLNKLGYLEDLEEQGLLIKLPCKSGDKIYYIGYGYVIEAEVYAYDYWISDGFGIIANGDFENIGRLFFAFTQFGNNVFLTREEAEETLSKQN